MRHPLLRVFGLSLPSVVIMAAGCSVNTQAPDHEVVGQAKQAIVNTFDIDTTQTDGTTVVEVDLTGYGPPTLGGGDTLPADPPPDAGPPLYAAPAVCVFLMIEGRFASWSNQFVEIVGWYDGLNHYKARGKGKLKAKIMCRTLDEFGLTSAQIDLMRSERRVVKSAMNYEDFDSAFGTYFVALSGVNGRFTADDAYVLANADPVLSNQDIYIQTHPRLAGGGVPDSCAGSTDPECQLEMSAWYIYGMEGSGLWYQYALPTSWVSAAESSTANQVLAPAASHFCFLSGMGGWWGMAAALPNGRLEVAQVGSAWNLNVTSYNPFTDNRTHITGRAQCMPKHQFN